MSLSESLVADAVNATGLPAPVVIGGTLAALAMLAYALLHRHRSLLRRVGAWLVVTVALVFFAERVLEHRGDVQGRVVEAGALELRAGPDGHFRVGGRVNGAPARFLVDTGASTVAIGSALAEAAGIRDCRPRSFDTAGGRTAGCAAVADSLSFGPFELRRVAVAVIPAMEGTALLGMNALRHVVIEQRGRVLRLSAPDEGRGAERTR